MFKYTLVYLQTIAGYGFCLNAMIDAKNGEFVSSAFSIFIASAFFIWAIRTLDKLLQGAEVYEPYNSEYLRFRRRDDYGPVLDKRGNNIADSRMD